MSFTVSVAKLKSFAFLFPYFAMIFIGLLMPSDGNHGIMTPKSLSFLGSMAFFFVYVLIKQRITPYQLNVFLLTSSMTVMLLCYLFLGLGGDPQESAASIDQFKLFIITISFVVMTLYAVSESWISAEKLIRTMILANFTYSCLKLSLIVLHVLGVINMFSLMEALDMRFMQMEMVTGVSRFQTSVDIVTPFFLLFVLQSEALNLNFSKKFKVFYCFVSSISIIFSFSRFLMGVAALSGLLYCLTLNKKGLVKALFVLVILLIGFVAVVGLDTVVDLIERRFFSSDNYHSDLTRTNQINALMGEFYKSPYFGIGLGGYVKDFVRDGGIVHSYEVQWVAFLMQFGVFGILFLLFPLWLICWQFIKQSFSRVRLSFLLLFLVWLLSGFTNPFLISLASGIVYSIFLLAALILNQKPAA